APDTDGRDDPTLSPTPARVAPILGAVQIRTLLFYLLTPPPPTSTLFPYTTLFRSVFRSQSARRSGERSNPPVTSAERMRRSAGRDRKSTRLNSSHDQISYAVFCMKKKRSSRAGPRRRLGPRNAQHGGRSVRHPLRC